jgi:hypothetical protein
VDCDGLGYLTASMPACIPAELGPFERENWKFERQSYEQAARSIQRIMQRHSTLQSVYND